jgi:prepilin-type N-terminal cleavage/methylation domain-containing protein
MNDRHRHACPLAPARCPAFTLVELLVVIAIVALLVGVLLPALGKARVEARRAATLVRLRDLGVGLAAYAQESKDRLPTLTDREEKAFLGLSLLAKYNDIPAAAFINPNTQDTPATAHADDGRPVLADLGGMEITAAVTVTPADVPRLGWHCSFAFDNDKVLDRAWMPVVVAGDRADYATGATLSANWKGAGMCLLWTDGHAGFAKSRTLHEQHDPNIYHHNEFGGEGADEARDGVAVDAGTLDTHLRFFSEDEDDTLLPD